MQIDFVVLPNKVVKRERMVFCIEDATRDQIPRTGERLMLSDGAEGHYLVSGVVRNMRVYDTKRSASTFLVTVYMTDLKEG